MNTLKLAAASAAILITTVLSAPAIAQQPGPQEMQRGKDFMQKSMGMMKPELLEKAKALPPPIQQFLLKVAIRHSRHSETLTMRQVMQEILADFQAAAAAIATDNGELAAAAALRVADHALPRGGMLPYLPLEKVNAKDLGVLPAMEDAVEGSARRLAAAATKGDMATAAEQLGTMTSGCVACHTHFRGQPGISAQLK